MKKRIAQFSAFIILGAFIITACSPVRMTTWVNPKEHLKTSKVVVLALFDKMDYVRSFEQTVASYLNSNGMVAVEANTLLNPVKQHSREEMKSKFDSIGADAVLLVTYTGTDKKESYVQTANPMYPDYYYNYYSFYTWGYPMVSTGYWTTTTVVNLRANLYHTSNADLLWSGTLKLTNPKDVESISQYIATAVLADWQKNMLINDKK